MFPPEEVSDPDDDEFSVDPVDELWTDEPADYIEPGLFDGEDDD